MHSSHRASDPHRSAHPSSSHRPSSFTGASREGSDARGLPDWLERLVSRWGVQRTDASWVGGVLGGVAQRYALDPLVTRGVFVALSVLSGGLGLLAYALAWAVLPDPRGRVQLPAILRGNPGSAGVAIIVMACVGAGNLLFGVSLATLLVPGVGGLASLIPVAATVALVWWLLTRWDAPRQSTRARRPDAGLGASAWPGPDGGAFGSASGRGASAADVSAPSWYARAERPGSGPARPEPAALEDPTGFRSDWIDAESGEWKERRHSREQRAEQRIAELSEPAAQPAAATATRRQEGTVAARRGLPPLPLGWQLLGLTAVVGLGGAAWLTVWSLTANLTLGVMAGSAVLLLQLTIGIVASLLARRRTRLWNAFWVIGAVLLAGSLVLR
ncbi:MAG: PspC domain-containing protein [Micrococcus sp.]|nr:PspC domain-containing protein [Micrococcus sp.]